MWQITPSCATIKSRLLGLTVQTVLCEPIQTKCGKVGSWGVKWGKDNDNGLSVGYQRVINEVSEGYQRVISRLSDIYQWVIRELSEGYQKVIRGL